MTPGKCLNCERALYSSENFCQQCGQRTHTHRFTPAHFAHEVFHAFTHTDKGIFHLLKSLALRPGTTAREYILGKRVKYFNPFSFFLILMGFFVLSNNYFHPAEQKINVDQQTLQRIPTAAGKAAYVATMTRVNDANGLFRKHGNLVAMVAIPFISLFTWLFFRKRGFAFTEHLTANMMFVAFSNLIFSLFVFPLARLAQNPAVSGMISLLAILLQVAYFTWALNGFLLLKTGGERAKSFFVSFTAILLWALFSMTIMAIYIYQGWDFYKFFTRMR